MPDIFVVNPGDSVATAMTDLPAGRVRLIGTADGGWLDLLEPLKGGHKAAIRDIPPNAAILKYGAAIGTARRFIAKGEWVHVHNLRSMFDERGARIDAGTGAAMDTPYE